MNSKTYKEYCLELLKREPILWQSYFLPNGKLKPFPSFAGFGRSRIVIQKETLKSLPKDGFKPWLIRNTKIKTKTTEASIRITGTQLFMRGKVIDMTLLPLPSMKGIRAYNKVWMHNHRVRCRIKILKEKFGITFTL